MNRLWCSNIKKVLIIWSKLVLTHLFLIGFIIFIEAIAHTYLQTSLTYNISFENFWQYDFSHEILRNETTDEIKLRKCVNQTTIFR